MSGRDQGLLLRLLALLAVALAATEAVRRLVTPPLRELTQALVADGRSWDQIPLETLVAGCCAAALSLAGAWLLLCGAVVAVDALRRGALAAASTATVVRGCPGWVRALVLAALGVAVTAGPALAEAPGTTSGTASGPANDLAGLALPDRLVTPARAPERHLVLVRPGDTLWAIAARQLPPTAADRVVDRSWRRLATANRDRVGDPDLIFPGTVLRVPDLARPTRKEAP